MQTIRPTAQLPYGTIGTAFDYRLRYYFAITPSSDLSAWRGAGLLCGRPIVSRSGVEVATLIPNELGEPVLSEGLIDSFFSRLDRLLGDAAPVKRKLDRSQEELLARCCIVLALFEEPFRASLKYSPLFVKSYLTPDDLLAIAEPHWTADLSNLSWLFYERFNESLAQPARLNPTFEGSKDIGGADADLILDDYLIDIKTTVNPRVDPQWLYQLLGYVLLDYSDRYQLRGVGLYLARQGLLLRWEMSEFLESLGIKGPKDLPNLRHCLQDVLNQMAKERQVQQRNRAIKDGRSSYLQKRKWAREVVRRWERIDANELPLRQRKSLIRAQEFLGRDKGLRRNQSV